MAGIGMLLAVLLAGFTLSLILPVLWLIICKIIRPLRRRPGISYGIAMALAFVWGLFEIRGDSRVTIIGAPFAAAFLFWQYKRAKANSLQPEPFARLPPAIVTEVPMR